MPLGSRSRAQPKSMQPRPSLKLCPSGEKPKTCRCIPPWSKRTAATPWPKPKCSACKTTYCPSWPRPNTRPSVPIAPAQSATSNGHNCNLNRRSRVSSNSTSPCKLSSPSLKSSGSPASPWWWLPLYPHLLESPDESYFRIGVAVCGVVERLQRPVAVHSRIRGAEHGEVEGEAMPQQTIIMDKTAEASGIRVAAVVLV